MNAAQAYADALIRGVDLQDDPWFEPGAEFRESPFRLAALYVGGGAWGTFLGVTLWWAYEFVTAAETVAVVALN